MSNKQFLINFQKFLIDLNLSRTSSEVLEEINSNEEYFKKNLKSIRFYKASQKVKIKESIQGKVIDLMDIIIKKHGDVESYVKSLIDKPEHQKVVALFRKFETLDKEDSDQILIESELIELLNSIESNSDKSS